MNTLKFGEERASFEQTLDSVCRDREPTVITRQCGEHVELEDDDSTQETLHLLGPEKNAQRLRESIAELMAGKTVTKELQINGSKAGGEE